MRFHRDVANRWFIQEHRASRTMAVGSAHAAVLRDGRLARLGALLRMRAGVRSPHDEGGQNKQKGPLARALRLRLYRKQLYAACLEKFAALETPSCTVLKPSAALSLTNSATFFARVMPTSARSRR